MVKQKIGEPKVYVVNGEEYEVGKRYVISGSDGEEFLCQVNPETGKLEEVKESGEARKIQGSQKTIQESGSNGREKQIVVQPSQSDVRWTDTEGLMKYLGIAKPTVYERVRLGKIKAYKMPGSRLLQFNLDEIDAQRQSGEKKAVDN